MISVHRGVVVRALAVVLVLLAAPLWAWGQEESQPARVRVVFPSGDIVTGQVLSRTEQSVTIRHPVLGEMTISLTDAASITTIAPAPEETPDAPPPPAPEAQVPPPAPENEPAPEEAEPVAEEPEYPWEIRFELGTTGSTGNTERADFMTSFAAERETNRVYTQFSSDYRLASEDGDTTENRLYSRARNEWKIPDTKWSYFAQLDVDADEFKDYDVRVAAIGGVSYRFLDDERERLVGRVGLGGAREFGSENDEIVPEALFGADYRLKINSRVTFNALAEYFPDLEDPQEFRARGEAALEVALNEDNTWRLRLFIEDRYESEVEGDTEKNDFFYGASLVLVF